MYDGSKLATVGCTSAAVATRTSPAPDRSAAAPQSAAAPAIPRDPAMTSTWPNRPLWLSGGRGPSVGTASIASRVIFILSFELAVVFAGEFPGRCQGAAGYAARSPCWSNGGLSGRQPRLPHAPRDQAGHMSAA